MRGRGGAKGESHFAANDMERRLQRRLCSLMPMARIKFPSLSSREVKCLRSDAGTPERDACQVGCCKWTCKDFYLQDERKEKKVEHSYMIMEDMLLLAIMRSADMVRRRLDLVSGLPDISQPDVVAAVWRFLRLCIDGCQSTSQVPVTDRKKKIAQSRSSNEVRKRKRRRRRSSSSSSRK
eukprot:750588-Hanusia_phi.AAC.3